MSSNKAKDSPGPLGLDEKRNDQSSQEEEAALNKSDRVKFEDFLKYLGENGRWQIVIFLFTWIEGMLIGCHHLSSTFLGASMDHWCNTSHIDELDKLAWTTEQKKQFAIPYDFSKENHESCRMYNLSNWRGEIPFDFGLAISYRETQEETLGTVSCGRPGIPEAESWEYDTEEGITSIVNDWDLVCERLPLLSTVQGSYMGGVFVGCLVFGWASDRFGRRAAMLTAIVIQIISSIVASFSVNYIMFIFFRFLIAFSVSGVFECGFVLMTEICGPKYRAPYGILTQFPFGMGAALLPLVAFFIREWHMLQLAISLPCLLLITYYWFVPESPRWLLAEGRFDEALTIMKKGAMTNGKTLPSDDEMMELMVKFKEQEDEDLKQHHGEITWKEHVYEVFKELIILVETPEMRKRTLNVFFSWLVVAMVYYGLSFNTKNLGGNRYVNVFVSGFVEVPAVVAILPLLSRFGRKKCYCGTFIAGGVCCGLVAFITLGFDSKSHVWLPVTVAMIGKFLISMTFAIAYLYTAELFPTKVRNAAVGTASTFARIGSMAAPYIVDLLGAIHPSIPVIIFGIFAAFAGLFSLLLPETLNKRMPETVVEVENWAKRKKKHGSAHEMNSVGGPPENPASKMVEA